MAGERLFLVPRAGLQSQAAELTAHKTREPWPRLPEGTGNNGGMLVGTLRGRGAARSAHDRGPSSTSVTCNVIRCLLVFTWVI